MTTFAEKKKVLEKLRVHADFQRRFGPPAHMQQGLICLGHDIGDQGYVTWLISELEAAWAKEGE